MGKLEQDIIDWATKNQKAARALVRGKAAVIPLRYRGAAITALESEGPAKSLHGLPPLQQLFQVDLKAARLDQPSNSPHK
jgi:hypothetical protein